MKFFFLPLLSFVIGANCLTYANDNSIPSWKALGPFLAAPQEGGIDHVFFQGGQENLHPTDQAYNSQLAKGGVIRWFDVPAKSGDVTAVYPGVDWKFLGTIGGQPLSVNQGYFYAEVDRADDEALLIATRSVGEFFVNGRHFFGEPYNFTFNKVAVPFKKGKNKILLKVSSYGDPEFHFSFEKPPAQVLILDDVTAPDLRSDQVLKEAWLGLPLINTTENWIRNLRIHIVGNKFFDETTERISFPLAPLSILKVPVHLIQKTLTSEEKSSSVLIEVFSGTVKLSEQKIELRVRNISHDESIKQTFKSRIDGSAQYYSVLFPKKFDPAKSYDAIISLHGANVEASELTNHFAPKDWAFVIGPTNRRPHGFAYQDTGRLDVLEVIEDAKKKFPLHSESLYLEGHSMGGEGTWHLGLHHPSMFAGLAPSAGWSSFQLYTPFVYQKANLSTPPQLLSFRDRVLMDSNNPYFIENAEHLPIYITQAEKDDNVPAIHARLFFELARNLGLKAEYREVDTDIHWFTEPLNEDRGFDSMDHPAQYEFLQKNKVSAFPKDLKFRLIDLGIEKNFYWVRVEEQDKIFTETELDVNIKQNNVKMVTSNVKALTLHLSRELISSDSARIEWNGQVAEVRIPASRKISLEMSTAGLEVKTNYPASKQLERHSMKSAFFDPYVIVYGTLGSKEETETLYESARLLNNRVWKTANGFAPILPDTEVSSEMMKQMNLILLGSPDRNLISKKLASKLPIKFSKKDIRFGVEKIEASDRGLAAAFLYPNPLSPSHYIAVFGGTSAEAEKFSTWFQPFFERLGFGTPDFLIYSEAVRYSGWGGVKAAGLFSKDWDLLNRDYALR
ncbi:MAG: hypothetical protein JWQ35_2375 [Bacteriovoracaceae bacterium]|nr:hypothetical protein [Bacteriovoracaceae bacterium]